jgi:uncharacterized glyoxalase superfamily protein PhnB
MKTTTVPITARAIFPSLKYDDVTGAIGFLCKAFGFESYAVFPSSGRAQLKLGSNFVMVGSTTIDKGLLSTPRALAGALGGICVVLDADADVNAHFNLAQAAGAEIVCEPQPGEDGGRNYTAADCEGYVWTFTSERVL